MRVLWYNWRDIKNPDAGGAEIFTHEVMRRLAKRGYEITFFTSKFHNCLKNEIIDDVRIIREGNKFTVYNKAKNYYKSHQNYYDLIIDEINTKPFLTTKFVKDRPIIALIHQLAREFWFYEMPFPLNYLGYYYLEPRWLSYYKNIPTITVSNSSKQDLEKIGFTNISIVHEGLDIKPLSELPQKEQQPAIVFLGRLKRTKLPHHAIEAFSIIKKKIPEAVMWVIGEGNLRRQLEKTATRDTIFYGHVDRKKKYEILSKAHLILVPAIREGWGLAVTEANAMGTPAVAYNVPGLRDSIKNNKTGILVKKNSPEALANSAILLLKNEKLLNKLSNESLAFSRQFNWDKTADEFDTIIKKFHG